MQFFFPDHKFKTVANMHSSESCKSTKIQQPQESFAETKASRGRRLVRTQVQQAGLCSELVKRNIPVCQVFLFHTLPFRSVFPSDAFERA
jgi:hypothetical protein